MTRENNRGEEGRVFMYSREKCEDSTTRENNRGEEGRVFIELVASSALY
jgi:hypothetical protein